MGRGRCAVLAAVTALSACSSRRVDVPPPSQEARTYAKPPRYRSFGVDGPTFADAPTFRWSSGRTRLAIERAHWLVGGSRLDATGVADGRSDSFILDTGSTSSTISSASPLAASLRFVVRPTDAIRSANFGDARSTEDGALPVLRVGDLEGHDVPFRVKGAEHSRAAPANVLGADLLQAAAIERVEGAWWLVSEPRAPWAGATSVPLSRPGVAVVTLVDAKGAKVNALLDTGAPMCIAFADAGEGPWTLRGPGGTALLTVRDAKRAGKRPSLLRAAGTPFEILVGLDALDAGTWRLDLERGVWEFAAPAVR